MESKASQFANRAAGYLRGKGDGERLRQLKLQAGHWRSDPRVQDKTRRAQQLARQSADRLGGVAARRRVAKGQVASIATDESTGPDSPAPESAGSARGKGDRRRRMNDLKAQASRWWSDPRVQDRTRRGQQLAKRSAGRLGGVASRRRVAKPNPTGMGTGESTGPVPPTPNQDESLGGSGRD